MHFRWQAHTPLVRQDEVATFGDLLEGFRAGQGCALALVGEPGIGKTRLMAALAAEACATGLPILPMYRLSEAGAWAGLPGRVAAAAGDRGAVVVTVDDLHLVDSQHLPVIEELIRLSATAPALLLLTCRERQLSRQMAAMLARAGDAGLVQSRRIGPLTLEQAGQLLGDRPDLERIHRDGIGNPLYMKALAAGDGHILSDAGVAVIGELAALAGPELMLAQTAAVLDEPFHPELVATVAGLSLGEALDALDTLTRLDLVRSASPAPLLAFRHPVVKKIIYERLELGRRMATHLRAAAELDRLEAPLTQRAHHIARGALLGRPEQVSVLVAAAREVIHSAPALAGEWLATAVSLIHEEDESWYEAVVLLAQARMLSGQARDSRDLLQGLLSRVGNMTAEDSGSAVVIAGRTERMLGRYAEAGALMRDGLGALERSHPQTAAALHSELADLALDRQDHDTTLHHATEALALARRHGDRPGEANALARAALAHLRAGDLDAARAAATAAGDLVDSIPDSTVITDLSCLYQVGFAEAGMERLADAERHLLRGVNLSRRTGQTFILPANLKTLGETQLRLGRLQSARDHLHEAERLAEHDKGPATRAIAAVLRAHALFWLHPEDEAGEALALADRAVALAEGLPWLWAVQVRCLHAELQLHAGDPRRCRRLLLDALGGTHMPRMNVWGRARWCESLTEAAIAEGELEDAAYWVKYAQTCLEDLDSPGRRGFVLRARMRLHARHGEIEPVSGLAQRAVESYLECGLAIEAGRTLVAAATAMLEHSRARAATTLLSRADTIAGQCGSARLAGQIRSRRGLADRDQRSFLATLTALTDRERQIAILSSTGLTRVEIAQRLYVSVRTVDSHLGRIYRKLGLSNRAGLTRTLLEPPAGG